METTREQRIESSYNYYAETHLAQQKKFYNELELNIPSLKFPKNWLITVIPPRQALIRFCVQHSSQTDDRSVSVYLDANDTLGCVDQPYWEIYPNKHGGCSRFLLTNTDKMIKAIKSSLRKLRLENLKSLKKDKTEVSNED